MANETNNFQELIAHCKEYGYIFQSSEIYDGLAAVYDYGQNGAQLKKNIRDYWWKSMTQLHDNIVGIDAAIFMHPTTWKASGHVDNFSDPMIDNKDSKKRYRVDHLIEGFAEELKAEGKEQEAREDVETDRIHVSRPPSRDELRRQKSRPGKNVLRAPEDRKSVV